MNSCKSCKFCSLELVVGCVLPVRCHAKSKNGRVIENDVIKRCRKENLYRKKEASE